MTLKSIAETRVLYIMATRAEYGSALQIRFTPHICGVGPVEAALNTTSFLSKEQPDLVVSLGSAGSAVLEQASVYQVSGVSYRDMDASAFGFPKGETPFLGLPHEIETGLVLPEIPLARLSTGANVVSGEGYGSVDADMVDMESWAILRACHAHNVPMIGLRGISDGAEPVADYSDWTRYLGVIDERLAEAVDVLEAEIEANKLPLKSWQPPQPETPS